MRSFVSIALWAFLWVSAGCSPDEPNKLDKMHRVQIRINDARFDSWVADDDGETERGLMFVGPEEMADLPDGAHRGMLFVFDHEKYLSFWMKNTIIPLDIAYIRSDGTIVKTYTMTPLDETGYPSIEAARFALEVRGGQFQQRGIREGDQVEIPDSLLNPPADPTEQD